MQCNHLYLFGGKGGEERSRGTFSGFSTNLPILRLTHCLKEFVLGMRKTMKCLRNKIYIRSKGKISSEHCHLFPFYLLFNLFKHHFKFGVFLCRNTVTQPISLHGLTLFGEDYSQILFPICFPFQTPALPPRSSTIAKPKDSPPVPPKQR